MGNCPRRFELRASLELGGGELEVVQPKCKARPKGKGTSKGPSAAPPSETDSDLGFEQIDQTTQHEAEPETTARSAVEEQVSTLATSARLSTQPTW